MHFMLKIFQIQWRKLCNQVSLIRRSFSPEIIQQYLDCFVMKTMLNYEDLYKFMLYAIAIDCLSIELV